MRYITGRRAGLADNLILGTNVVSKLLRANSMHGGQGETSNSSPCLSERQTRCQSLI